MVSRAGWPRLQRYRDRCRYRLTRTGTAVEGGRRAATKKRAGLIHVHVHVVHVYMYMSCILLPGVISLGIGGTTLNTP